MKHFFRIFLLTLLMFLLSMVGFGIEKVSAAPASEFMQTPHFQLEPVSVSSSPSTKVAGIYWLPDYLKDNLDRSSNPDNQPIDPNPGRCGTYGMLESCGYPKVTTGEAYMNENLKCQRGCVCPDQYKYNSSNCNGDRHVTGNSCDGKYTGCVCNSEFKYTSSNCSGEYKVSGTSCDGSYNSCIGKSCSEGGYYASSQTNKSCSTLTYGGKTCYNCYTPSCSEGGYSSSKISNQQCTSTTYFGQTCYSCRTPTCSEGGYSSSASGYNCSSVSYFGQTCYSCSTDPCAGLTSLSCDNGCASYYSQCPSKCQSCKTCNRTCGNEISSKPSNSHYNSCSDCSGTYNTSWSCDEGYKVSGSSCVPDCDPMDRNCTCPGYVYCDPATKTGSGATCTAGSLTFYKTCLVKETCTEEAVRANGGTCYGITKLYDGSYKIRTRCTKQDGTPVYDYALCDGLIKDCNGNYPPAHGLNVCDGTPGGKTVKCGNKTYSETCTSACGESSIHENGGTCYRGTHLMDGYYEIGSRCTKDGTTIYKYYSCTGPKDCTGKVPPSYGKKECPGDSGTGMVICGNKKYFKTCTESCTTSSGNYNGTYYSANTESNVNLTSNGLYKVADKCIMSNGQKVILYDNCNSDKSTAPCKGYLSYCGTKEILGGKKCTCGGKTYGEYCLAECPYEDTAKTCAAQGKSFEQKCHGDGANESQWTWYGICK